MRIRAARDDDERRVRALCARIWKDDYLPECFGAWVRDRRGRLWVAVEDGRVVGVAKLTLLGDRECWLHALRVDPAYRRRGVATALLEHRLARARRLGARVARLDTSEDNVAVLRLMRRYGFRRVERATSYGATAAAVDPPRRARMAELDALWSLGRGRLLQEDYAWRGLARSDVARAIRLGRCFVFDGRAGPAALAIAEVQGAARGAHGHRSRLRVRLLAGSAGAMRALLSSLRGEARRSRVERATVLPPAPLWRTVRAAGYRRRWREAILVFERRLEDPGILAACP